MATKQDQYPVVVVTGSRPPASARNPITPFSRWPPDQANFNSFKEAINAQARANDPFTVPRGQLTFDAEGQEGGPLHSRKAHWPGKASGVTIGRGYDMKERSEASIIAALTTAGVPKHQAEALAKGAGLSGQDAAKFIQDPDIARIEITPEAQKALFAIAYKEKDAILRKIAVKPDTVYEYKGKVDVDKLHPAIHEVAIDLIFRGDYDGKTRVFIQPHLVNNDLKGLYNALAKSKPFTPKDSVVYTDIGAIPRERFLARVNFLNAAQLAKPWAVK